MDPIPEIHHLLSRAAFGPALEELEAYRSLTPREITDNLFERSETYTPLQTVPPPTLTYRELRALSPEEKRELRKKNRELLISLNRAWMEKMIHTDAVLREKMTLFWHDHFACRTQNAYFAQDLNNRLREHALGNFGDLLIEVSKSPAMIRFLNNQQNKKQHPNENFAREVMELFTLGIGHYTEEDIKEAARAFTGWSFTPQGKFLFRKNLHDSGSKTFLGKTGNFGGEEILRIILEQKQTARFITRKIYRYFINDEIDEAWEQELAGSFYDTGYDMKQLMYRIFTDKRFYAPENHLRLIKSPVELLAGYGRLLPLQVSGTKSLLFLQRALGQVLFFPPNVGGWPYGTEWIDSNSLPLRMQLPGALYGAVAAKNGGTRKKQQKHAFTVNWQKFISKTRTTDERTLALLILGRMPDPPEQRLIDYALAKAGNETDKKIRQIVAWMSMPEYQMM